MRPFKPPKNVGDVEVVENVRVDVTEPLFGWCHLTNSLLNVLAAELQLQMAAVLVVGHKGVS